jgi:hypothetical protein
VARNGAAGVGSTDRKAARARTPGGDVVNIGRPKRIIEIEPAELPLPDPAMPVFEPGPAPAEPLPLEPTHAPSEPAEPPAAP